MTATRTFTPDEIARLFKSQAHEPDFIIDLGEGFKAIQQAAHSGLIFQIERNGKAHALADADAAELKEISGILWARFEPFINTPDSDLTPDELKDKPDDGDPLVPDELREKPDPANLEADPLGLTPDSLRAIIADPELARRLATGTATAEEKTDSLLTPDNLK
jgi:hypothetical protein